AWRARSSAVRLTRVRCSFSAGRPPAGGGTLSLHDALPIFSRTATADEIKRAYRRLARQYHPDVNSSADAEERFKEINEAYEVLRSEEHTSELQSRENLVCRLLLEKKNKPGLCGPAAWERR